MALTNTLDHLTKVLPIQPQIILTLPCLKQCGMIQLTVLSMLVSFAHLEVQVTCIVLQLKIVAKQLKSFQIWNSISKVMLMDLQPLATMNRSKLLSSRFSTCLIIWMMETANLHWQLPTKHQMLMPYGFLVLHSLDNTMSNFQYIPTTSPFLKELQTATLFPTITDGQSLHRLTIFKLKPPQLQMKHTLVLLVLHSRLVLSIFKKLIKSSMTR